MLARLLTKVNQIYRSLPILGAIVEKFTDWISQRGFTLRSSETKLEHVRHLDQFFQKCGLQNWQELTLQHFDAAWEKFSGGNNSMGGTVRKLQQFLQQAQGLVLTPARPATRIESRKHPRQAVHQSEIKIGEID